MTKSQVDRFAMSPDTEAASPFKTTLFLFFKHTSSSVILSYNLLWIVDFTDGRSLANEKKKTNEEKE